MSLGPVQIRKYELLSGVCPFDQWFDKLTRQDQALVDTRLDRVCLGNFGDANSLGDGVFELKFRMGSGFRIYYGRSGKQVVLLLCAGNKRTQSQDIASAKRYWLNFKQEK